MSAPQGAGPAGAFVDTGARRETARCREAAGAERANTGARSEAARCRELAGSATACARRETAATGDTGGIAHHRPPEGPAAVRRLSPAAVPAGIGIGSSEENRIFGFWVFLAGEAALFASLIGTFLAMQHQFAAGPNPDELFDLPLVGAATFVLLTSSLTGALAVQAVRESSLRRMQLWLVVTIVLGEIFLGIQAWEFYTYMTAENFTLSTSAFSSAFFVLVGFHGLHVTFGVYWLLSLLFNSFVANRISVEDASRFYVAGLYWHFVDVVWVIIFSVVYLIGKVGV